MFPSIGIYLLFKNELKDAKKMIHYSILDQVLVFCENPTPTILFNDAETAKELVEAINTNPLIENANAWSI